MSDIVFVRFDQLVKSPRNVRKKKVSHADVKRLAENIEAVGLLQNLVVSAEGEKFAVEAGGTRLDALTYLHKKGKIKNDHPVPVKIIAVDQSVAASLIENVYRHGMHPVEEFEAFHALIQDGIERPEICKTFHVTEKVLNQRLKLAGVHPEIRKACRDEEISLDCMMAFTLADNVDIQKAVYDELNESGYSMSAERVRALLTQSAVKSTSALAIFVGKKSYIKAGGTVTSDMFEDVDYFNDAALLRLLAKEKLGAAAEQLTAEGWKWVSTDLQRDWSSYYKLKRLQAAQTDESMRLQAEFDALEAELEKRKHDEILSEDDEQLDALYEKLNDLEDKIEAAKAFSEEQKTQAGCLVFIGNDGELHIDRGMLRTEDTTSAQNDAEDNDSEQDEGSESVHGNQKHSSAPVNGFSQTLTRDLWCHRLAATRLALAQSFDVAFDLMLVTMIKSISHHSWTKPLGVSVEDGFAESTLDDVKSSIANEKYQTLKNQSLENFSRMDTEELLEDLSLLTQEEKQKIFAVLVAHSLRLPTEPRMEAAHRELDRRLAVDVRKTWTPSAENLFSRVKRETLYTWGVNLLGDDFVKPAQAKKKSVLVKALDDAFSESTIAKLNKLEAEDRLKWVPPVMA